MEAFLTPGILLLKSNKRLNRWYDAKVISAMKLLPPCLSEQPTQSEQSRADDAVEECVGLELSHETRKMVQDVQIQLAMTLKVYMMTMSFGSAVPILSMLVPVELFFKVQPLSDGLSVCPPRILCEIFSSLLY